MSAHPQQPDTARAGGTAGLACSVASTVGGADRGTRRKRFALLAAVFQSLVVWLKGGGAAWVISAATHAGVLVVLSLILVRPTGKSHAVVVDTRLVDDEPAAEFTSVLDSAPRQSASQSPTLTSVVPLLPELPAVETPWTDNPDSVSRVGDPGGGSERAGRGNGGNGTGTAGFFGASARGKRFAYVVDASGSMGEGGRFLRARAELLRSLQSLESDQEFYVIFFNDRTYPLYYPRRFRKLLPATPLNKERVAQWILQAVPDGGTHPKKAIVLALELEPDAIFFLSDGEFDPETLIAVRNHNEKNISVHTIGFENRQGEPLLEEMARQNRGTYRFVP